jgi:hypothetical protein
VCKNGICPKAVDAVLHHGHERSLLTASLRHFPWRFFGAGSNASDGQLKDSTALGVSGRAGPFVPLYGKGI